MEELLVRLKGEGNLKKNIPFWPGTGFLLFLSISVLQADTLPQALSRAEGAYSLARSNYLASPAETESAATLARACFELSELNSDNGRKAALAQEGIGAARVACQMDPNNAEGFYFLALNQGDLARTKSLGALSLLRQMEKSLLQAGRLNPHLEHAGPDRSLGMLYLDAPGWPVSMGSKRKAREHLERAVALEPDYPDNQLSLLEAYARSNDPELQQALERYRRLLPDAKKKYSGAQWEQAWHDWQDRLSAIQKKIGSD